MKYHITTHYLYNITNRKKEFMERLVSGITEGHILPKCDEAVFALLIKRHEDRLFSREAMMLYLKAHPEHFPTMLFMMDDTLEKEEKTECLDKIIQYSGAEEPLATFFVKSIMYTRYLVCIQNKAKWDACFSPERNAGVPETDKFKCTDSIYKAICELLAVPKLHSVSWVKGEKGFCVKSAIDLNGKKRTVYVSRPLSIAKDERKAVINSVFYNISKYILYLMIENPDEYPHLFELFDLSKTRVVSYAAKKDLYESDLNDIYNAFWIFYNIFDGIMG